MVVAMSWFLITMRFLFCYSVIPHFPVSLSLFVSGTYIVIVRNELVLVVFGYIAAQ